MLFDGKIPLLFTSTNECEVDKIAQTEEQGLFNKAWESIHSPTCTSLSLDTTSTKDSVKKILSTEEDSIENQNR